MSSGHFSIARDFTRSPGPRFRRQGPFSGEELRPILVELLKSVTGRVKIDLDGTTGMGSSFLDEAFGGLVRVEGFSPTDLENRLILISSIDETYPLTIVDSIRRSALQ